MEIDDIRVIARIRTDFPTKFGLPRQSGLCGSLKGRIVFEKEFRSKDSLRGLEEFDHIWVIWKFSEAVRKEFVPTVRPPRLGGNTRIGVFATRSPFRPNPIGLSCLKIESIEPDGPDGPVITVSGIDMMDGTPIYDIKPYLPYADIKTDARGGFADSIEKRSLDEVIFAEGDEPWDTGLKLCSGEKEELKKSLTEVLLLDPRPSYQDDESRVYGFFFREFEVRFSVKERTALVLSVMPRGKQQNP